MRSSMSQEHLTGLALMHVHIDIAVSVEEIITRFAVKHCRRLQLPKHTRCMNVGSSCLRMYTVFVSFICTADVKI